MNNYNDTEDQASFLNCSLHSDFQEQNKQKYELEKILIKIKDSDQKFVYEYILKKIHEEHILLYYSWDEIKHLRIDVNKQTETNNMIIDLLKSLKDINPQIKTLVDIQNKTNKENNTCYQQLHKHCNEIEKNIMAKSIENNKMLFFIKSQYEKQLNQDICAYINKYTNNQCKMLHIKDSIYCKIHKHYIKTHS